MLTDSDSICTIFNLFFYFRNLLKIALGSVYSDLKSAQIFDIQKLIIHKGYFYSEGNHDIGLIKLKKAVKFGKTIFIF